MSTNVLFKREKAECEVDQWLFRSSGWLSGGGGGGRDEEVELTHSESRSPLEAENI